MGAFDDNIPKPSDTSPSLQRLQAAAGLVSLIEDGLAQKKIDRERAALMAEFCGWASDHGLESTPEVDRLSKQASKGLGRLKALLACPG